MVDELNDLYNADELGLFYEPINLSLKKALDES